MAGELGIGMIGKEELPALGGQVLNHKPLEGAGAGGGVCLLCQRKEGKDPGRVYFGEAGFGKQTLF